MKTQIITIAVIICILPFAGCHIQKEKEKGLEKFRNGPLELCEAIEKGNIKAVKAVIKKGIDVDLPAKKDEFPLFYAAGSGRPEITRLLIQAGANVNIKDSYGDTALHIAIRECNYKVAEILIHSGADVNAKIEKGFFPGFRPLHTAVNGKKDIPYLVSLLISKGAEVNSRDAKGKTPLQYAIMNRFSQSEQILLKHEKSPGNIQKNTHFPVLKGSYLGQKPPGMTPEVFAPGIVSTDDCIEAGCTFTPDLKEFYFVRGKSMKHKPAIMACREAKDGWTIPEVAPFSGMYFDFEPHVTPDGTKMFFMRFDRSDNSIQRGLWVMERIGDDWGEPRFHGPGMYATATKDGTIYFTSPDEDEGIVCSRFVNGQYLESKVVGGGINTPFPGAHPCISPDESFMVFDSRRPDEKSESDLYVCFRNEDGTWGDAFDLGSEFNKGTKNCAALSPDGKYLYYTFFKSDSDADIYWVSTEVIKELKPEGLK